MAVKSPKFTITWVLYLFIVVLASVIVVKAPSLSKYYITPGLIVGAIFPLISLLYYYKHFVEEATKVRGSMPGILNWLLPSLFVHLIVIFGFIITLYGSPGGEIGQARSMYTSFYDYAHIFKSFRGAQESIEKDIVSLKLKEKDAVKNYGTLLSHYCPYFPEVKTCGKTKDALDFASLANCVNRIPFLIALSFGFLGALIFCLRDASRRYNTKDLYAKTYVFYIVRFIVSCALAVTLAYYVVDDWPSVLAPLVFFLIGYFPERVIVYFDEKVNKYLSIIAARYKQIPLSMVQGISKYKIYRLREIGVADAQNLAVADIEYLEENLPYPGNMLCDWIAQSMLFVHFPEDIETVRHVGLRTILDFDQCVSDMDDNETQVLAEKAKLEFTQLKNVKRIMELPHIQARMKELNECLGVL